MSIFNKVGVIYNTVTESNESADNEETSSHIGIYVFKHFVSLVVSLIFAGAIGIAVIWFVSNCIVDLSIVEFDYESAAAAQYYLILMVVALIFVGSYEKFKPLRSLVKSLGSGAWIILSKTLYINEYSEQAVFNRLKGSESPVLRPS